MRVAMMFPEATRYRRGGSNSFLGKELGQKSLSFARTVLSHAPDLTASVLSGAVSLNDAYKQAQERKTAAASYETKFAAIKAQSLDLATLVKEERITLAAAEKELEERRAKEAAIAKNKRTALLRALSEAISGARLFSYDDSAEEVRDILEDGQYKLEWGHLFPRGWETEVQDLRNAKQGIENLLKVFPNLKSK